MIYQLYTTSEKAWDAMIETIDQAEKSIYIEMYIFLDDTAKSHDFIGKLRQKALAGVRVVIVADSFGSGALKKEISGKLVGSDVELIFFSNWLRHIHRKVLIVDEKIAFIGGVNIGKSFAQWNDIQIRLTGRIVRRILRSFAYTYEMAGGKDLKILEFREGKFSAKLKSHLIEHWPAKNIHTLKSHYVEKITGARKNIRIVTPYFTPPRWLISLLDDAVRRGLPVEIFVPKKSDWKLSTLLNYRYIHKLYPMGIRFYLSKNMNHAKLLIIDDEEVLIGSQNIDPLSFGINYEMGIFFQDRHLLRELLTILQEWKNNSLEFNPQLYKMRFTDYVILALTKMLHPIL